MYLVVMPAWCCPSCLDSMIIPVLPPRWKVMLDAAPWLFRLGEGGSSVSRLLPVSIFSSEVFPGRSCKGKESNFVSELPRRNRVDTCVSACLHIGFDFDSFWTLMILMCILFYRYWFRRWRRIWFGTCRLLSTALFFPGDWSVVKAFFEWEPCKPSVRLLTLFLLWLLMWEVLFLCLNLYFVFAAARWTTFVGITSW